MYSTTSKVLGCRLVCPRNSVGNTTLLSLVPCISSAAPPLPYQLRHILLCNNRTLSSTPPQFHRLRRIVQTLQKFGAKKNCEGALRYIKKEKEKGTLSIHCYTACFKVLGEAGRWRDVLSLFRTMEVLPTEGCYASAIWACAKSSRMGPALALLRDMKLSEVKPGVKSYTAAIMACGNAGNHHRALELIEEMKEQRLVPDVFCFSAAIAACARAGHPEEALKVLSEMHLHDAKPNLLCYHSVISSFARGEQYEQVLKVFDHMQQHEVHPDAKIYKHLFAACEQLGRADLAVALIREMCKKGIKPSVFRHQSAVLACAKAAKYEGCVELLNDMRNRNLVPHPNFLQSIRSVFEQKGERDTLQQILELLQRLGFEPSPQEESQVCTEAQR